MFAVINVTLSLLILYSVIVAWFFQYRNQHKKTSINSMNTTPR